MLNNLVIAGVILAAVPLSIFVDMPSGPLDLDVSMFFIRLRTFSSVHSSSSGQLVGPGVWKILTSNEDLGWINFFRKTAVKNISFLLVSVHRITVVYKCRYCTLLLGEIFNSCPKGLPSFWL